MLPRGKRELHRPPRSDDQTQRDTTENHSANKFSSNHSIRDGGARSYTLIAAHNPICGALSRRCRACSILHEHDAQTMTDENSHQCWRMALHLRSERVRIVPRGRARRRTAHDSMHRATDRHMPPTPGFELCGLVVVSRPVRQCRAATPRGSGSARGPRHQRACGSVPQNMPWGSCGNRATTG